jgi:3-isopropylmalate/(R)-2-methylmalate dehydratase small subunit
MTMKIIGKTIKYGDDVNTDVIIPGKYLTSTDPNELAKHAMEGLDPDFPEKVKDRTIIIAGRNFGCGSSREQAPLALKQSGVKCILAEGFARIFYRNAINLGLPVLECEGVYTKVSNGDELCIDLKSGLIEDFSNKEVLKFKPPPEFLLEILDKGLIEYMKQRTS